jgi:hypothetical protein
MQTTAPSDCLLDEQRQQWHFLTFPMELFVKTIAHEGPSWAITIHPGFKALFNLFILSFGCRLFFPRFLRDDEEKDKVDEDA